MSNVYSFPLILVLGATGALLLYAAWIDLRCYTIRNELVAVLAGLFVLSIALSGRWEDLPWHAAFAGLMLAVMLVFYARHWMGGGDVKILAVAFLWTGSSCALPFAMLLALFSAVHGLAAKLGWVGSRDSGRSQRIPFAPSVAGAMIGTFMLGCLHG